jgi:hypothetical protein
VPPPVLASPAAPSDDAPVAVPDADLTVNEQTLATLEKFLAAVHVARADRSP